jgi:hypothetical protein
MGILVVLAGIFAIWGIEGIKTIGIIAGVFTAIFVIGWINGELKN